MASASQFSPLEAFIRRWENSGGAERANYQLFLAELCDVLEVPRPNPAGLTVCDDAYVFERAVTFANPDGTTSPGRIDLYRRGCFVLEAKQGSDLPAQRAGSRRGTATRNTQGWTDAMLAARGQAERYARALPPAEGWPPFLVVVDVGHSIHLYSDFTRSGHTYVPFPDSRSHRIPLRELVQDAQRERLRQVWLNPLALDPSRRSARITREVAARLAELAASLEQSGHEAGRVASFLMRCLFTMFAEDVRLIPAGAFTAVLERLKGRPELFCDTLEAVWKSMAEGGYSPVLMERLLRFNGGLFESAEALPVTGEQLELLTEAARSDWSDVEPAIFGTLLERALDTVERHKLGAHFTPRAYVERLVLPTIVQPLREEWIATQAAAVTAAREGSAGGAVEVVRAFHRHLCNVRVLDPACGSGNFLYVTLEHLKRLEGEVLDLLNSLGQTTLDYEDAGLAVDPHQFLGIELNPRAVAIADLVLWIGYLQWHFRTRGEALPREPVLQKFRNIECRDAVLDYVGTEPVVDDAEMPVTRWDGRTLKKHPVTGEEVPDESARAPVLRFLHPTESKWPESDYVIGNPPFIGTKRMRSALGDGYVNALRAAYSPEVEDNADYVMFWWHKAAALLETGSIRAFGLITTNSISHAFNRRVVARHLDRGLRLSWAIPDHPWTDLESGASVRVAMTCCSSVRDPTPTLLHVESQETDPGSPESYRLTFREQQGSVIHSDLRLGADVASAVPLRANIGISGMGVALHGAGFILTPQEAARMMESGASVIREYIGGRDLLQQARERYIIDFSGLSEAEARVANPAAFQHLIDHVKPERLTNARRSIRELWWRFGWEQPLVRAALRGLRRYVATAETARHRVFQFLPESILPDHKIVVIATECSYHIGVLSSRVHVVWAITAGGRLGVGNDPVYGKVACFDKFPFPSTSEPLKTRIRGVAEELEAHRRRQQATHPRLKLTDMYNVLEKLRAGEPLTEADRVVHEQGLISVLRQLHDELDAAVFAAYGWPTTLTDEEVLERLVALNAERAAEERRGLVRWLRPEYQNPGGAGQGALPATEGEAAAPPVAARGRVPWPASLPEQVKAVRAALAAQTGLVTPEQLAAAFLRAPRKRVEEVLAALDTLGQAREVEGRYSA